jgi:nitrite reductase/ring-hydroxylating ferredoxin subunit
MSKRERETEQDERDDAEARASGPEDPSRRRALKVGVGVLGGGLALIPTIPALAYLAFPLSARVISSGGGFLPAGRRRDFSPTIPVKVDLYADRSDAWSVTRDVKIGSCWVIERDGELTAFSSVCPHLGCAVDFDAEASAFKCPCHRSEFNLTGSPVHGPAPRSLDTLEIEEDGDLVAIRFKRFRQGVADKVEV